MNNDIVKRLREPYGDVTREQAADRIEELEAKLAKALSALEVGIAKHDGAEKFLKDARTTLAELTGGTND